MLELSIPYFVPHSQCSNDNLFSCRTPARVGPSKLLWITLSHGRKQPKKRVRAPYAHKAGGGRELLPPPETILRRKVTAKGSTVSRCPSALSPAPPPGSGVPPAAPGTAAKRPPVARGATVEGPAGLRRYRGTLRRPSAGQRRRHRRGEGPAAGSPAAAAAFPARPPRPAAAGTGRSAAARRGRPLGSARRLRHPQRGDPSHGRPADATRRGGGGSRGAGGTFPPGVTGGREAGRAGPAGGPLPWTAPSRSTCRAGSRSTSPAGLSA